MQIYGPAHVHGAQPINQPHARMNKPQATPESSGPIRDELQLSAEAQKIGEATSLDHSGEVRMDKVNDIRQQIADGTYETEEKLEAALDRFIDMLG